MAGGYQFESYWSIPLHTGLYVAAFLIRLEPKSFNENIFSERFFSMLRAAAKFMMKKKKGRIVNISSVVGFSWQCWASQLKCGKSRSDWVNQKCHKGVYEQGYNC